MDVPNGRAEIDALFGNPADEVGSEVDGLRLG